MTQIEKQQDGTIKIIITLQKAKVASTRDAVIEDMVKQANVSGFRKGKAPKEMAKNQLHPEQIREEILKRLLPQAYIEAVQEHKLNPIMNPKMHVEKIEDDKDWIFYALTCEMPIIELGEYKNNVKKVTAKSKIIIPGKEEENKKPSLEEIMKALLTDAKVQIPQILIEQEADRLLAQLLNDIKRLGLSLDQYLASTNRKPEDLRAEYTKRAADDIKLEFILQKIAELEKITVDEKEIEEAIQKAKDPAEKENLTANKYVLAGILRQQKTLDLLMNL
ncbi:MAG TPA: trigger factor [Candidatus Sulfotelmatobacter sp.]|jgi:FKBP-type peptidyl-prolyl cis-trans isomerase (trigger factor)|nr:trigger factor [Candidatus Sulfotelmatobacter sp.]